MKIIKIGGIKIKNSWWAGRKPTCLNCRTSVELEAIDRPAYVESEPHITACFICPACGRDIQVIKA